MKTRLAAVATALGSAVVLAAIAGPSAFADTASPFPSPSPSGSTWSSPVPSPSGSTWSSPVPSPSGSTWSSPVPSPSGSTSSSPLASPSASAVTGSPSGSPSSITQLPPAAQADNPSVGFESMPTHPIVVGGAPAEFTVTYTNPSHQDLIAFPNLFVPNTPANPGPAPLKLEVQDPQGAWHPAAVLGSGPSAPTTWAMVYPGPQGDPWDNSWLYLPAGEAASIHVRLTAGPTTPTGVTYAASGITGSLLDASGTPVSVASGMWGATLEFAAAGTGPQASGSPSTGGTTASSGANGSNGSTAPTGSALPTGASSQPGSTSAVPASLRSEVAAPPVQAPAPAVIAAAKAASPARPAGAVASAGHSAGPSLAFTGGGSDSLPIALTGAAVVAAGVGTLVVFRRRKGSHAA